MKNLRIAVKLALGFGLVLILTGIVAFVGYNGLNTIARSVDIVEAVDHMATDMLELRRYEKDFVIRGSTVREGDTQNAQEKFEATFAGLETEIEEATSKLSAQRDLDARAAVGRALADYKAAFDEYVSLTTQADEAAAQMSATAATVFDVAEEMRLVPIRFS